MCPWYARGMHYELDPGVVRMKKCGQDHKLRMDETLGKLILEGGGVVSEHCGECEAALIVMWYGADRWEMREFAPREKERK